MTFIAIVTVTFSMECQGRRLSLLGGEVKEVSLRRDAEEGSVVTSSPVILSMTSSSSLSSSSSPSYFIITGNERGHFEISQSTGLLLLTRSLLQSEISSFSINVTAVMEGFQCIQNIKIKVIHSQGHGPRFSRDRFEAEVLEGQPPKTLVTSLSLVSDIYNNWATFDIVEDDMKSLFSVDMATGVMTTKIQFDRELQDKYIVTVTCRSNLTSSSDFAIVVVMVMDDDDNAPRFLSNAFAYGVMENMNYQDLASVVAYDEDDDGDDGGGVDRSGIRYSIVGGNEEKKFFIDPTTGRIWVMPLDREVTSSYNLTIQAADDLHNSTTGVNVRVSDVNDNAPRFEWSVYRFSVQENSSIGSEVGRVEAKDPDAMENADLVYLTDDLLENYFKVDTKTGRILVARTIDREEMSTSFRNIGDDVTTTFTLSVIDGSPIRPLSSSTRIEVTIDDLNDNPPKLLPSCLMKAELSPTVNGILPAAHVVMAISSYDPDSRQNNRSTFSLLDSSDLFQLEQDGRLTLKRRWETGLVHGPYEEILRFTATDLGSPPLNSSGLIIIKIVASSSVQDYPRFTSPSYQFVYNQSSSTSLLSLSSYVGRVSIKQSVDVAFAIVTGNDDGLFSINSFTGEISIRNSTPSVIHRRRFNCLVVSATVPNSSPVFVSVDVSIVSDLEPTNCSNLKAFVTEGSQRGTLVTQLTQRESGSTITITPSNFSFTITSGNLQNAFTIDSNSDVRTNTILDREIRSSYKLEIRATPSSSSASLPFCINLSIQVLDVNDNSPSFPSYPSLELNHDSRAGTLIGRITANDLDLYPPLTYHITGISSPNGCGVTKAFDIDRYAGQLWLVDGLANNMMCFGKTVKLIVQASDGPHNTSIDILINISRNSNIKPHFSKYLYKANMSEAAPIGREVIRVSASFDSLSDVNDGYSPTIAYSLQLNPPNSNRFTIDASTGVIKTSSRTIYDTSIKYTFLLVVANGGRSKVTVIVEMEEKNKKPEFLSGVYNIFLPNPAKQVLGSPVLKLNASDQNQEYLRSRLRFSLVTWSPQFLLSLDNGILYLVRKIYSSENLLLTASVSDWFNPEDTSFVDIKIATDYSPCTVFEKSSYDINMTRNISNVTSLVLKTSAKFEPTNPLPPRESFNIVKIFPERSISKIFLNKTTGKISIKPDIDVGLTIILIEVFSKDCPPSYTRLSIRVNSAANIDDVVHLIVNNSYASLTEDLPVGSHVMTIKVFSSNNPPPDFRYSLSEAADSKYFTVNNITGEITTSMYLNDTATNREFEFKVFIDADIKRSYQTVVASVKVKLDPEPKQPVFPANGFRFEVNLENNVGDIIGTVSSVDETSHKISGVMYYLKEDIDYFSLNRSTGDIVLMKSFANKSKTKRSNVFHPDLKIYNSLPHAINSRGNLDYNSNRLESRKKLTDREDDTVILHRRLPRDETDSNFSDILTIAMRVIARSGFKIQKEAETSVIVKLNRTCVFNCSSSIPPLATPPKSFSGASFVLLVVFSVVGLILITVSLGLLLRCLISCWKRKRKTKQNSTPSVTIEPMRETTFHNKSFASDGAGPPEISRQHAMRGNLPSQTRSESSGRGSIFDREADEEIRMINLSSGRISSRCSSSGTRQKYSDEILPDSGVPDEERGVYEEEFEQSDHRQNKTNYHSVVENGTLTKSKALGVKYINAAKLKKSKLDNHAICQQNGSPSRAMNLKTKQSQNADANLLLTSNRHLKTSSRPDYRTIIQTLNDKISTDSYDGFREWYPNYESLSSVFDDISKLKYDDDDAGPAVKPPSPKRVPTKIVPQVRQPQNFYDVICAKSKPPPIITDAPPPSVSLATHPALMRAKEASHTPAISAEDVLKRSANWSTPSRIPVFNKFRDAIAQVLDPRNIASSDDVISVSESQDSPCNSEGLKRRLKNPRNRSIFVPIEKKSIPMTSLPDSKSDQYNRQNHASTSFSKPTFSASDNPASNIAFITPDSEFDI